MKYRSDHNNLITQCTDLHSDIREVREGRMINLNGVLKLDSYGGHRSRVSSVSLCFSSSSQGTQTPTGSHETPFTVDKSLFCISSLLENKGENPRKAKRKEYAHEDKMRRDWFKDMKGEGAEDDLHLDFLGITSGAKNNFIILSWKSLIYTRIMYVSYFLFSTFDCKN